jgi:hypothetical protein
VNWHRHVRDPSGSAPTKRSLNRAAGCIDAVRSQIARDGAVVAPEVLIQIGMQHRVDRFPEALLIEGRLDDRSASGASAALTSALRADSVGSPDPHPLFSRSFYLWGNSDVAAAGVSPWLHYQQHGCREGRSPHPLFDLDYMSEWAPDVPRSEVVDRYLRDPALWMIDTSPYIDCQKFILRGGWSGMSSPIAEIVRAGACEPWVHSRLMAIDADLGDSTNEALGGVLFLLARNHPRSMFSRITVWHPDKTPDGSRLVGPHLSGSMTVVPGFFIGSNGIELWSDSRLAMSQDLSLVRFSTSLVGLEVGERVTVDELQFVCGGLRRESLVQLLKSAHGTLAVGPVSWAQERALCYLVEETGVQDVTVLPWGRQVRVDAAFTRQVEGSADVLPVWRWPDIDPRDVVFVDAGPLGATCAADVRIGEWLRRGASLVLIDDTSMECWVSAFIERRWVVATPATEEFVGAVVPWDRTALLGENEVAGV